MQIAYFYYLIQQYTIMHAVDLDITGAGMSKLRNGHSCRCGIANGDGVKAFLSEGNIKKMLKNARKGSKAVIKLTKEEIDHNRHHGSGIMEGGKFSFHKAVKAAKKAHVGKTIKNVATSKPGRMALSGIAAELAGDAMGPEAAPIAYEMANSALGGKFSFKHAAKSVAHSKPAQALKKKAIGVASNEMKKKMVEAGVPSGIASAVTKAASKKVDKSTGGKFSFKHAVKSVAHSKPAQSAKKAALKKIGDEAKKQMVSHGVPGPIANAVTRAATKKADKASGGRISNNKRRMQLQGKKNFGTASREELEELQQLTGVRQTEPTATPPASEPDIDWGSSDDETVAQAPRRRGRRRNPNPTAPCTEAGKSLRACGGAMGPNAVSYGGTGIAGVGFGANAASYGGAMGPNAVSYGGAMGPNAVSYGSSIGTPQSNITNIGSGGNLLSCRNPALRSQPYSANFYMHTQLPPALAQLMLNNGK
jgi:hypothetical protein